VDCALTPLENVKEMINPKAVTMAKKFVVLN